MNTFRSQSSVRNKKKRGGGGGGNGWGVESVLVICAI